MLPDPSNYCGCSLCVRAQAAPALTQCIVTMKYISPNKPTHGAGGLRRPRASTTTGPEDSKDKEKRSKEKREDAKKSTKKTTKKSTKKTDKESEPEEERLQT